MRTPRAIHRSLPVAAIAAVIAATSSCGTVPGDRDVTRTIAEKQVAPYDWLQYNGDARHSGNNALEQAITAQNVATLTTLFQVSFGGGGARSAPAVLTGVSTSGGTRDLLFLTTNGGTLLAIDAHTGATVWSQAHSGSGSTWSSPAVDPSRKFVYSYGLDGSIHKHSVADGSEVTGGGWPELASLKPSVEQAVGALTIATTPSGTFLYAIHSGYDGDGGDYQGHLTTVNLATGAQTVFNGICSDKTVHFTATTPDCASRQGGAWAREGILYDSDTSKIYFLTGNGPFDGTANWGDSVLALHPDGTGANAGPLDSYTPSNQGTLQSSDLDLGSSGPVILPGTSRFPHLAVHVGKDQTVRLLNLDDLSGQGSRGHVGGEVFQTKLPQGGEVQNATAVWTNPSDGATWAFLVSPSNGIAGMKVSVDASGNPSIAGVWTVGGAAGSALVANNVLYYETSGSVHAVDPTTGRSLWSGAIGSGIHWQSPVVANGVLYAIDNGGHLTAFGLPAPTDAGAQDTGTRDATIPGTRLNAGGPAVSPFAADEDFSGGSTIHHANAIDVSGVSNPAPAAVYQTARIGNFTYTVPGFAAGSSHVVRLHFAETYFSAEGKRVFDVAVNGTRVLTSFDVFKAAGDRMNKAVVEEFTQNAGAGGQYAIQFTSVVNNSLVSAIEIQ